MIEKITGTLLEILPTNVIVDVSGVGYGIELPLNLICKLEKGQRVSLWIYTYLRENVIKLFGFSSYVEKRVFEILLEISGVGPKVAMAILSSLSVGAIKKSIQYENSSAFLSVPGIGPRLAERILMELKPKLSKIVSSVSIESSLSSPMEREENTSYLDLDLDLGFDNEDDIKNSKVLLSKTLDDVQSALENLGFKEKNILPIMNKLKTSSSENMSFQDLLKIALSNLRPNS